MKTCCLIMAFALSVGLYAETTVKSSAPFAFPTTVGVAIGGQFSFGSNATFIGKTRLAGTQAIDLSWSLPVKAKNGSISLFTVSGARIKTIPIASPSGNVSIDISSGKLARGIYFAKLSYGACEKTINFIVCR